MSLIDILSTTDLRVIVDSKIGSRSETEQTIISVRFIKADSPSDLLTRALALEETPVAAITTSGTVYILSPGTHGLICLQGTTANKAQKITMQKLAKAYLEATRQGLPDWYVPKIDPDTIVRHYDPVIEVIPEADEVVSEIDSPIADIVPPVEPGLDESAPEAEVSVADDVPSPE